MKYDCPRPCAERHARCHVDCPRYAKRMAETARQKKERQKDIAVIVYQVDQKNKTLDAMKGKRRTSLRRKK